MNHFERIPWISAHPEYVKRGTFCSELSRIATLSSRFSDYVEACREVADIYIARGYPPKLIASWLKTNYQVRWDNRLREIDDKVSADVLVLKSEYNLSWDFFNVQTLAEQMKAGWITALRTLSFGNTGIDLPESIAATKPELGLVRALGPLSGREVLVETHASYKARGLYGEFLRLDKLGLLDKRFIVSKKRTTQLIDLVSIWRKSVLERRDRAGPQVFGPLDRWVTRS